MKRKLLKKSGEKEVLLGNEAIARGAIEAGVKVIAAYPGTPSSEIVETFLDYSDAFDYYAEWSVNEKVAFELVSGSALTGVRSLTAMKGAGLNVIMDMFLTLPYTGVKGAMVVIIADDPGAHYSSNEQDSRIAAQWAKLPCLEPESQQEAKEMTREAFALSERLELPVIIRSVTRLSHSSGVVEFGEIEGSNQEPGFNKHYNIPYRWNVYGPPGAVAKHQWLLDRMLLVKKTANQSLLNTLEKGKTNLGVIASGMGAAYSREVLRDLHRKEDFWFLKLGWVYPFPDELCEDILKQCEKILVVEDGEPFIETQLRLLAQENNYSTRIFGRLNDSGIPDVNELDTEIVKTAFRKVFEIPYPVDEERREIKQEIEALVVPRSSTLCAGCSHLGTYWALMKEAQREKQSIPIINGDIGCYEQAGYGVKGQMPNPSGEDLKRYPTRTPYNFLDTLYVMGSGISMAQGEIRAGYSHGEVVAVAGDSTFFHTCMPGLLNAVWNETKVTFVVMDNSWTAMTGHQVCPATGINPRGVSTNKIKIEDVASSFGVQHIQVVNAYDVDQTTKAVRAAMDFEGPSLVVTRGECMLQVLRREGKKPAKTRVLDTCIGCKTCLQIGCPAINFSDRKASIDTILCVDCGLCSQICPHQAIEEEV